MLVKLQPSKVNDSNRGKIEAKDCYEVLVVNQSSNLIFVDKVPIPALTERYFTAPPGKKWADDFILDVGSNTSSSVDIYVVKTIDA